MMSGHDVNPIFFYKNGRPEHLLPLPLHIPYDREHFILALHTPSLNSQIGRHICITPKQHSRLDFTFQ